MDWNHSPGALDAELLEEGCGDDGFGGCECVRVEEGAADYTNEDDAETTAKDLGAIPDHGASGHGSKVGNDLSYGYGVGREAVLVL